MPYILLALAVACALYYFFVYKKHQSYKEEKPQAPPVDPSAELYEEEPYEEEEYAEDGEPYAEEPEESKKIN